MSRLPLLALAVATGGCFNAGYLAQAAGGEYELLHVARPISRVVADPSVPERVRHLLAQTGAIKSFGRAHGLKATPNYTRYSDLHRSAAVWVVQACAPLKFETRHWRFPIVGSVPYLGFFDEAAARAYAAQVASDEHLDAAVRTASAFSTLGWFRDPVLSTMIPEGDEALGELAEVILHESVHATLYVSDQSAFNESAASFVSEGLTEELLEENFGGHGTPTMAWRASGVRYQQYAARLHQTYETLDALYRSELPDAEKLARKAEVLRALQTELRLRHPLNNASLAGSRTYSSSRPGFERLHAACGTWPKVIEALSGAKEGDFSASQQEEFDAVLDRLATRGCR